MTADEQVQPPRRSNLPPPSRGRRWSLWILVGFTALVAAAWWTLRERIVPAEPEATDGAVSSAAPSAPPALTPAPLPPVEQADDAMRRLLARLSAATELQDWMKPEDLARRLVAAVAAIAEGRSPRTSLPFLAPAGAFRVVEQGTRTLIAPESHARYDRIPAALATVDLALLGELYPGIKPLLDSAYYEIGAPGTTFEGTLSQALARLIGTPVPEGGIEVIEHAPGYRFADPGLEELSAAQKHLLRMGPANMRAIQEWLHGLAAAMRLDLAAVPAAPSPR